MARLCRHMANAGQTRVHRAEDILRVLLGTETHQSTPDSSGLQPSMGYGAVGAQQAYKVIQAVKASFLNPDTIALAHCQELRHWCEKGRGVRQRKAVTDELNTRQRCRPLPPGLTQQVISVAGIALGPFESTCPVCTRRHGWGDQ